MNKLSKLFLLIIIILIVIIIIMTILFFNMKKVALNNYHLYQGALEQLEAEKNATE